MIPINTSGAPAAIGPYVHAIRLGDLLFTSGQIPLDPHTGEIIPGDITAHTRRVMDNLHAVLAAAGVNWNRVVKTVIFLTDMNDFAAVNAVYAEYFANIEPPARSTIQVAALPKGARVEIEMVAAR